ncbi:MAG TPA: hypothetical protein EYP56_23170 [Planctomycetaceae bacterium]|nr:hypothetical protein [Planctomycetaceae bacterium]
MILRPAPAVILLLSTAFAGCQSPYYADRGAVAGGLLGAGTGAIVGDAVGRAGAGAAIGAGVGALAGAAVGQSLDEIEARNRATIEAQLGGRRITPGACTVDDVIMMSQAGVEEQLIVNHIRANGVVRPPTAEDLIRLEQNGVSTRVVAAMQEPPARAERPVVYHEVAPPPLIVEEHVYGPPWGWHCYRPHNPHGIPPRLAWGLTIRSD